MVYKFVFVRRLVLNVHFVRAVLQPLFVSYALFIHLFYPCAYSTLIQNLYIKLVGNIQPYSIYIKST